ncbi:MAG TPA: TerC family protein [Vicinamibacterales bacterium]|nr:TerC family protein [Vicinamibacterales bacterium]
MTEMLIALVTLTVLEIVLGVDNIIFIAILSAKLPKAQQKRARRLGLLGAMGTRILLLLSLNWMANLTEPFVTILGRGISGRDVILIGGGLFLLAKATFEIHDKIEGGGTPRTRAAASFSSVIAQVMILDIVFSLDSVITAVGMANVLWVMVTAIVLAVLVMLLATEPISSFVELHPTIKILALSFLLLIGISLIAEGLGQHMDKRYIYFAMGFSVFVEMINIRIRGKGPAAELHRPSAEE